MASKQVIVYFPNWGTYNINHQNITVGMIPWNKVTIVQHAFFQIGSDWKIASTDDWADFQKPYEHSETGDLGLKGHFGEYKYYKSLYPIKKLLLSIGGWTKSYNFSEMASNTVYRKVFIDSCISFLKMYPFFDGIDIDWEYPKAQDKLNFTILLKELKKVLNDNNMTNKLLTIAVPAGNQNIINQDVSNYKNFVDLINIMSYDYYGAWNSLTNHHSPLYYNKDNKDVDGEYFYTDSSVKQYLKAGAPKEKLCIGSPLYSRGWKEVDFSTGINNGLYSKGSGAPVGTWDEPWDPGGQNPWYQLKKLENDLEWKKYYDNISKAPYLVNKTKKQFFTYEDEASLKEKCNYILANNLAGLIIWEISGDDLKNNSPMVDIAWNLLDDKIGTLPLENIPPKVAIGSVDVPISLDGSYTITFNIEKNNSATTFEVYENNILFKKATINSTNSNEIVTYKFTKKANGIYSYIIILKNKVYSISSSPVIVKVQLSNSKPVAPTIKVDKIINTGTYIISIINPSNNNATKFMLYENNKIINTMNIKPNTSEEIYKVNMNKNIVGSFDYKGELSNINGSNLSSVITVKITTIPKNTNIPTIPILSHDNVKEIDSYSITSNMNNGINATKLTLYENDKLIDNKILNDKTPNAQSQIWKFNNKSLGQYKYYVIAENAIGKVQSKSINITVSKIINAISTIEFIINSDWGTGADFGITINNNETIDWDNWVLEFDFEKKINSIWNASMTMVGNHYIIKNPTWGGNILAGKNFKIGGGCSGGIGNIKPENAKLNG